MEDCEPAAQRQLFAGAVRRRECGETAAAVPENIASDDPPGIALERAAGVA